MKKVISMMIILALIVGICISSVFAENMNTQGLSITHEKISEDLQEKLDSIGEDEKIGVYIILYDLDAEDVMADFASRFPEEYDTFMLSKGFDKDGNPSASLVYDAEREEYIDTIDADVLQSAIEHKREVFREHYKQWNGGIADNYINKEDIIFVSEYTQMIIANLNKMDIYRIAELETVYLLEPFYALKIEPELSVSNQVTGADYVRDSFGNQGGGVKVGILDGGVPDLTASDLSNASITNRTGITTHDHSTIVAQIIAGTADGIAPSAELYCTGYDGSDISFYSQVEWLVSQGVNAINMSAKLVTIGGSTATNGVYDIPSRWIDAVVFQYEIHYIKLAGNTGNYITSPGLGYNVITVGGYNTVGTVNEDDDIVYGNSSYNESASYNRPEKPNLIASAQGMSVVGHSGISGTSYAAPQVTGAIAQLCSLHPVLKTRQSSMGAILAAGCEKKIYGTLKSGALNNRDVIFSTQSISGSGGQISNIEGAGKLYTRGSRWVVSAGQYWRHMISVEDFPFYKTFYQAASTTSLMRVAIFWLKQNTLSGAFTSTSGVYDACFDDLDLEVFDPNGNSVGKSQTFDSNYEIVQFVPVVGGYYTIRLTLEEDSTSNYYEYVGIAVW